MDEKRQRKICFACTIMERFDHKSSHMCEKVDSEVSCENNEFLSLLEKIPRCDNVDLVDITEWLPNDEDEKIDNNIVTIVLNEEELLTEDC